MRLKTTLAAAFALAFAATAADAKCTRLAFSVNDYGKDGPTKDAKDMLDKHIAKWAAENGVKNYTTGKKTVSCELYLDLILFDEHTCKAEASVCWGAGGPATTTPTEAGAAPKKAATQAKAAPKAKAAAAE
jgi:hypothetical protein